MIIRGVCQSVGGTPSRSVNEFGPFPKQVHATSPPANGFAEMKIFIEGQPGGFALLTWDLGGRIEAVLETSTDLKNWEDVGEVFPWDSALEPTEGPRRFWRLRAPM